LGGSFCEIDRMDYAHELRDNPRRRRAQSERVLKGDPMSIIPRCLACASFAILAAAAPALADPVADFYRGKTISLYVGFPPGGGYDLYARVFGPYFARRNPRHSPLV